VLGHRGVRSDPVFFHQTDQLGLSHVARRRRELFVELDLNVGKLFALEFVVVVEVFLEGVGFAGHERLEAGFLAVTLGLHEVDCLLLELAHGLDVAVFIDAVWRHREQKGLENHILQLQLLPVEAPAAFHGGDGRVVPCVHSPAVLVGFVVFDEVCNVFPLLRVLTVLEHFVDVETFGLLVGLRSGLSSIAAQVEAFGYVHGLLRTHAQVLRRSLEHADRVHGIGPLDYTLLDFDFGDFDVVGVADGLIVCKVFLPDLESLFVHVERPHGVVFPLQVEVHGEVLFGFEHLDFQLAFPAEVQSGHLARALGDQLGLHVPVLLLPLVGLEAGECTADLEVQLLAHLHRVTHVLVGFLQVCETLQQVVLSQTAKLAAPDCLGVPEVFGVEAHSVFDAVHDFEANVLALRVAVEHQHQGVHALGTGVQMVAHFVPFVALLLLDVALFKQFGRVHPPVILVFHEVRVEHMPSGRGYSYKCVAPEKRHLSFAFVDWHGFFVFFRVT